MGAMIAKGWLIVIIGMVVMACSGVAGFPAEEVPRQPQVREVERVVIQRGEPNLLCAVEMTVEGNESSVSCTSPTATAPMLSISGSEGDARHLIVLDPTKQAVATRVLLGEEWIKVPVMQETAEAHLMAVWLVHSPDRIEVVDGAGRVLASVPPK
jgi:hypothetical protein